MPNKQDIIKALSLVKHIEGGYFSETYRSQGVVDTNRVNTHRSMLTSIYYMLTNDSPIGHFHKNKSDVVHYFHGGSALTYILISPDGQLEKFKLGNDLSNNQTPQLIVRGGYWKATVLEEGEYGLLGEAVSPGFDYLDMEIAKPDQMKLLFPNIWNEISKYIKSE